MTTPNYTEPLAVKVGEIVATVIVAPSNDASGLIAIASASQDESIRAKVACFVEGGYIRRVRGKWIASVWVSNTFTPTESHFTQKAALAHLAQQIDYIVIDRWVKRKLTD